MRKKAMIYGMVFMFIAFFLFAIGITSDNVKAEGAAGTWTGTATDSTDAADFNFDVTLTLSGGSSLSGDMELTCTGYDEKMAGWVDSSVIGTVTYATVEGTLDGSSLTLYVTDSYGISYTFYMTISGDSMTGGSEYSGATTESNSWTFELSGGGGFGDIFGAIDADSFTIPASLAFVGGSASIAVSFLPGPSSARGYKNRAPVFQRERLKSITYPARIPQPIHTQQPKNQNTASQNQLRPPSADPKDTLNLPIQEELGPTNGNHLVPWDAPQQFQENVDPPGYPYPKGTNSTMECQYCHCLTLSPFTTGWYCTNPLCPARREWVQKRATQHKYNKMTWRGSQL